VAPKSCPTMHWYGRPCFLSQQCGAIDCLAKGNALHLNKWKIMNSKNMLRSDNHTDAFGSWRMPFVCFVSGG
jgi:hypothetical protein